TMEDPQSKRNFRVSYYDKVGFRGIGEKALVAILKDDVIERKKLEHFCIRFPIPNNYRDLIWEILLHILPSHQQSHKFVMVQRTQQYDDLHRALEVMKKIDTDTELPVQFLKMHLTETGKLHLKFKDEKWHEFFYAVGNAVCELVDSPAIAYWITVSLHSFFTENKYIEHKEAFHIIVTSTVKKENNALFTKLNDLDVFHNLPFDLWYAECYAHVFPPSGGIERIWDLLLGRACRILPYIAAQILLTFERHLLHCANLQSCLSVLKNVPFSEATSSLIIGKGIELWKKMEKI
uniref:TBC1 domain family member 7 n=1 Tax=Ciona savignyi TaxID=51511 RepID=H2YQA5_CIOSA